jgi:hypothetical protein
MQSAGKSTTEAVLRRPKSISTLNSIETFPTNISKEGSLMKKIVLTLIVVFMLVAVPAASAAVALNLPAAPVTVTHGPWLGNVPTSTLAITLSNVPAGYDVTDGVYNGWCIEDNGQDNAPSGMTILSQPTGAPWDKINWILNNWTAYSSYHGTQVAIWILLGYNSGITPEAQALLDAATLYGVGFEPGVGQKVAVTAFSDNAGLAQYQDTIIEVTITEDEGGDPGTGTPGYWKNHPEAWPVDSITIGEQTFTKEQAIALMTQGEAQTGKGADKTLTLFRAYVAAYLNGLIGNETSCVDSTMVSAYNWLNLYNVPGQVLAKSDAWTVGSPLNTTLDDYNNGLLCAPHRD